MNRFALALTVTLGSAALASSPGAIAASSYGAGVLDHAIGLADGALTDEQENAIASIAYQAAAARVCSGLDVAPERFAAAVNTLAHADGDLTAEETTYHERLVMLVLGVATGGFIAEFMAEPDTFCVAAENLTQSLGEEALLAR